jgi:hypothetical protein
MALDEQRGRLYVGCRSPAMIVVCDLADGVTISSPACVGDVDDLFVDDRTQRLYVIGGAGAVRVFSVADQGGPRLLATVATRSGARTGLFDATRGLLSVACPRHGRDEAEILVYVTDIP